MNTQVDSGFKSFVAGGAITQYSRVKKSSGTVVVAGAGEDSVGVAQAAAASGADVCVKLWNAPGTFLMIAADTMSANATVYGAADGEITDSDNNSVCIGIANEACTVAGQYIEVIPTTSLAAIATIPTT